MSHRFSWGTVNGENVWGKDAPRHLMSDAYWRQPAAWNRLAAKLGVRLRVFCASLADVFEDHLDVTGERARLWDVIAATPNLDWLLLTKRPENIARMVPPEWMAGAWPINCWMGATMENQRYANVRTRHLRRIPAPVIFASYAPARGPVVFDLDVIDWVIAEGESGHHAHPAHPEWFRSARDQCAAASAPFHLKQNGEWLAGYFDEPRSAQVTPLNVDGTSEPRFDSVTMMRVGLKRSHRLLDGREWMQVPVSPALDAA